MKIMGIETSCDETAVAIVEDGTKVLVNLIATQVKLHAQFGGVVPELASRAHIQKLVPMIQEALNQADLCLNDLDAFAVTQGPGLVGALLIGVETTKALAFASGKPLIPVHHIAGHLYAPFLSGGEEEYRFIVVGSDEEPEGDVPKPLRWAKLTPGAENAVSKCEANAHLLSYPFVGLVVSGGHSSLVLAESPLKFQVLGETVDDAAGEAFDKLAKLLDLGYPGGPLVQKAASLGTPRFDLPRPMMQRGNLDFSFSGLKTAALKLVHTCGQENIHADPQLLADICASFQEAVVEVLLRKAGMALKQHGIKQLAVVGGVACNGRLRSATAEFLPGKLVVFPPPVLCTDNAAMIAGVAWHARERHAGCDLALNATADLPLGSWGG